MRNNAGMSTGSDTPHAPPPPRAAPAGRNEQVQSLIKGLTLLGAFANAEVLGNQELARRTGYPKATVSRLTSTLSALGYLRRDDHSFCPTSACWGGDNRWSRIDQRHYGHWCFSSTFYSIDGIVWS